MSYLSESFLRTKATQIQERHQFSKSLRSTSVGLPKVFLSHSHEDRDLVAGLIQLWGEKGIMVYVDWNDHEMPYITSRSTAERIKKMIAEHHWFIVFATNNAMQSKWVPWELGVADQLKGPSRTLIIPVASAGTGYVGAEYLRLYNRIEITNTQQLTVYGPDDRLVESSAKSFLEAI